jgi:hypothetical protein
MVSLMVRTSVSATMKSTYAYPPRSGNELSSVPASSQAGAISSEFRLRRHEVKFGIEDRHIIVQLHRTDIPLRQGHRAKQYEHVIRVTYVPFISILQTRQLTSSVDRDTILKVILSALRCLDRKEYTPHSLDRGVLSGCTPLFRATLSAAMSSRKNHLCL